MVPVAYTAFDTFLTPGLTVIKEGASVLKALYAESPKIIASAEMMNKCFFLGILTKALLI